MVHLIYPLPWCKCLQVRHACSVVEGDVAVGLYWINGRKSYVIVLHKRLKLFWFFINTIDYHLGWYKPSSSAT